MPVPPKELESLEHIVAHILAQGSLLYHLDDVTGGVRMCVLDSFGEQEIVSGEGPTTLDATIDLAYNMQTLIAEWAEANL